MDAKQVLLAWLLTAVDWEGAESDVGRYCWLDSADKEPLPSHRCSLSILLCKCW